MYELASVHAIRGETDAALYWLTRAADAGWSYFRLTARDPVFASTRDEPRFQQVLEAIQNRIAFHQSVLAGRP